MPEQLKTIADNLKNFGPQRLAIMGGVAAFVFLVIGFGAWFLNRPAYETLYVGLERSDVNQIGMVLSESGIGFDVDSSGTTVMVPVGKTAQARTLLAEKGLPSSTNAGYELFDNVGSLGLTSFMQQVTRVRALEGEIARTLQSISGIKAARVHLVMPERANFRRDAQQPTASVVIRAAGGDATQSAMSIRHLVAAAVPGLNSENVTVLDSSGTLLASGDDPSNSGAARSLIVQKEVENQIQDNIRRALLPYLGPENFRASVSANVNTDQRQTEEMIYDPESRIERSVQTARINENSNQRQGASPTTVEQNLPEADPAGGAGPESTEQNERREETTNYELSSKRVATVSNGYALEKMSIAVVINEARLGQILGENAAPEERQQRLDEIRTVVASATGFNETRGDVVNVSAVTFIDEFETSSAATSTAMTMLNNNLSTIINAAAFIAVVFLVTWFGVRPVVTALSQQPVAQLAGPAGTAFQVEDNAAAEGATGTAVALNPADAAAAEANKDAKEVADLKAKLRPNPQERLGKMVQLNEERTAMILRKWAALETA